MKKLFIFFLVIVSLSCKKQHVNEYIGTTNNPTPELHTGITYPDTMNSYWNILTFPDYYTFSDTNTLVVGAILEADAHLKIIITNYPATDSTGQNPTGWMYSNPIGFTVSDYDTVTNTQTLTSNTSGNISMELSFVTPGVTGSCKIDYYENSSSITKTRHYQWQ
jgi:hypothetical protein